MVDRKQFIRMGVIVAITTFIMLFFAVRFILRTPLESQNYLAFLIFSLLAGSITAILVYTQARIAAGLFMLGLGLGFFEMYRVFMRDMAGWGDLIGLLSLFFWAAAGLGAGLLIQFGVKIFNRKKRE